MHPGRWRNGAETGRVDRARLGQRRLELVDDPGLRLRPDDRLRDLAVLEQDHGRDRQHLVLDRRLPVVVGVQLYHADIVALGVDLLEDRRDHPAGTAPSRPEIDKYRSVGLEYFA